MADEIDVVQGVLVFAVRAESPEVHVDLYGGEANVCGTVRFTFADPAQRQAMLDLLEQWRHDETPVTFVQAGTTISLQNDATVFGRQLARE